MLHGARVGILLEAHHHLDPGAEPLLVEGERLLATAVEKQIGLDRHFILLGYGFLSNSVSIWIWMGSVNSGGSP
jgi:hypothetical protein